jgi:hypothetical protein
MNKKYYFPFLAFFVVTLGIAGPGGGPPPPAPPPPPGFPLDGNLFYLFVFGLLLAFLKLKPLDFKSKR